MSKKDFLQEILDACALFHYEVMGAFRYYTIKAYTTHFVQVTVIHVCQEHQYTEVFDFENNECLIDEMLTKL